MGGTEMIVLAVAAIIGIFILIRIAKTIFSIAILGVVLFLLYYFFVGSGGGDKLMAGGIELMLKNTTITELMDKYCTPDDKDGLRCKCAITPIYNDLNLRYSKSELAQLEQNKERMSEEMLKSYQTKKEEINTCLQEKKDDSFKWLRILKDLFS